MDTNEFLKQQEEFNRQNLRAMNWMFERVEQACGMKLWPEKTPTKHKGESELAKD